MTVQQDIDTDATLDIVELTAHLGEPADQQEAVFSFSGVLDPGHLWTGVEAEQLAGIWAADTTRIENEG